MILRNMSKQMEESEIAGLIIPQIEFDCELSLYDNSYFGSECELIFGYHFFRRNKKHKETINILSNIKRWKEIYDKTSMG